MISRSTEICATAAQLAGWSLLLLLGDMETVLHTPYLLVIGGVGLALVFASSLQVMVQSIAASRRSDPSRILIRNGLYRCVRHPLYTGMLIASVTVLIAGPTVLVILAYLLLALTTNVRAALEEAMLQERNPEYGEYRARTKRFIPFVL